MEDTASTKSLNENAEYKNGVNWFMLISHVAILVISWGLLTRGLLLPIETCVVYMSMILIFQGFPNVGKFLKAVNNYQKPVISEHIPWLLISPILALVMAFGLALHFGILIGIYYLTLWVFGFSPALTTLITLIIWLWADIAKDKKQTN